MNPFDLPGPQFLAFYALLVVGVLLWLRRAGYTGQPEPVADPLELAFLRGGPGEAIRNSVLSLLDRRLLKASEGKLEATASPDLVRRPVEKALLAAFAYARPTATAFSDGETGKGVEQVGQALERRGLVPGAPERARRTRNRTIAQLFLVAVAGVKVAVALSRGRHNVLFLVGIAGAAVVLAAIVGRPGPATRLGDAALSRAKDHFQRLRTRAGDLVPGGETNELALLMALYGFGALPPLARDLLTEAHIAHAASSGGSSCGSSCGSSFSSSCSGGSSGGDGGSSGCGGCGGGGCS